MESKRKRRDRSQRHEFYEIVGQFPVQAGQQSEHAELLKLDVAPG